MVKPRKFPHFLDRKWDHERAEHTKMELLPTVDGYDRDPYDEEEPNFSLMFSGKKFLYSEGKVVNNKRIVVVGAGDTGLSFVETLL